MKNTETRSERNQNSVLWHCSEGVIQNNKLNVNCPSHPQYIGETEKEAKERLKIPRPL